jgi:two-component system chemotaxis sensor kinase CheA
MSEENAFAELIHEYVAECLPLAERVADVLLGVERAWRAGGAEADEIVALKGVLHTVKGNSAMMGLALMQNVAHALEDLCAAAVAAPPERRDDLAALLVEGSGLLADLVRTAAAPEPDAAATAGTFVQRARGHLAGPAPARAESPLRLERRGADRRLDGTDAGSIRVDFRRLDALLEIFGEAMIEQSALPEVYRRLAAKMGSCAELAELDRVVGSLSGTMKRLESELMRTRLLPVSTVFGRFGRLVRDLARGEGKAVRLTTEGGDTRLDKTILDRLGEPLVHLLTNAVVHGVEPAEDRARRGKSPEATITLRAAALADRAMIRVDDDGRGLDHARILARARALGLEVRGDDPAAVHAVLFTPGFSTADAVTQIAGRGVGLDAAAAAIHAMGGDIDVASEPGRGTTFTLAVPLTLAIVRSLIVEVDRERYAVPLTHVAETLPVDPGAVHEVNRQRVVVWRGAPVPVDDGGALLGTAAAARARKYLVMLFAGSRRRAVLVDRLVGHQDVVVKRLDPALGRPEVVSGTTILGDGRVACILDAAGIVAPRAVA